MAQRGKPEKNISQRVKTKVYMRGHTEEKPHSAIALRRDEGRQAGRQGEPEDLNQGFRVRQGKQPGAKNKYPKLELIILGFYRDNGKENGNYYGILG